MIRFVELINQTTLNSRLERTAIAQFSLEEVWINQKYVVSIREAVGYTKMLQEGRLTADLSGDHEFTSITLNNGGLTETHVVVGSLSHVARQLHRDPKILLKG